MSIRAWLFKKLIQITTTHSMDYATERANFEKASQHYKVPKDIMFEKTEIAGVPVEWAYAEGVKKDQAVVFLHGGGYCFGSVLTFRFFTARIAKESKLPVMSVEYSLVPEHPFPTALNEVVSLYRELLASEIPAEKIAFLGDSAGGGLAVASVMKLRDLQIPLPSAIALLSPWMDLTNTSNSCIENVPKDFMNSLEFDKKSASDYAKAEDIKNPLISPLFGSFANLPPMFIHGGTEDIYLDDSTRTINKAVKEGVEVTSKIWEGMVHDFTIFLKGTPESSESIKDMVEFLKKHLNYKEHLN